MDRNSVRDIADAPKKAAGWRRCRRNNGTLASYVWLINVAEPSCAAEIGEGFCSANFSRTNWPHHPAELVVARPSPLNRAFARLPSPLRRYSRPTRGSDVRQDGGCRRRACRHPPIPARGFLRRCNCPSCRRLVGTNLARSVCNRSRKNAFGGEH